MGWELAKEVFSTDVTFMLRARTSSLALSNNVHFQGHVEPYISIIDTSIVKLIESVDGFVNLL